MPTDAATATGRSRAPAAAPTLRADTPKGPDELHRWLGDRLRVYVPRAPLIEGHAAPFHYLCHSFFEGVFTPDGREQPQPPSADCVVWANRGGGKTFLGAVATLLDLLFKPGIQIRILGGSLEQSQRMYEHLRRLLETPGIGVELDGKPTIKRVRLAGGACAEVLAASQTSVRGTRVQKLRCDEVDLFDHDVWEAAQLTTRSMPCAGPWGGAVLGSVEALSTMHRPFGLMWELVGGAPGDDADAAASPEPARAGERPLFRWGLLDVLEPCGPAHACPSCTLLPECQGRAKASTGVAGHIRVADAIGMKSRVDAATWQSEMLCRRPRRSDSVYPEFDPAVHVVEADRDDAPGVYIAGMDFGFRAETAVLLARVDPDGTLTVEREHVASGWRLEEHIDAVRAWAEPPVWIGIDPAGNQRNGQTGLSDAEVLRAAGFRVRHRASSIQEGLRLVRSRLAPASSPESRAVPRLFVHRHCPRLIECLQRYHYPLDDKRSLTPVKDGFDHACDALRYLVINLDRPGRTELIGY